MKKSKIATIFLCLGFLLTGCGGNSGSTDTGAVVKPDKPSYETGVSDLTQDVKKLDVSEKSMSIEHGKALSTGGFQLLKTIMEMDDGSRKNILISPFSIQMALGMTAAGAKAGSDTEKGMMTVLMPGSGENSSAMNEEMATFAKKMRDEKDVSWHVANSIWVNNDGEVMLRDSFISDAVNYYEAALYSAPFDQSTVDAINGWVKENTKERIPSIIDELSEDAKIALVNAVAFDGKWKDSYEENAIEEDCDFHNADGSTSKVTMLKSTEKGLRIAGGLGFVRNYEGVKYGFVGLLPSEGETPEQYVAKILSEKTSFASQFLGADSAKAQVSMPEFKAEYGLTINDVLKSLGMEKAFSDAAEFDDMITDDSAPVKIGLVNHRAMIEVDRTGTKAAASTIVVMEKMTAAAPSESFVVCLDRPFVYAIVDLESGVPVFLGVQNSMK